jgi:tRNA G37 N-methylase Trm5
MNVLVVAKNDAQSIRDKLTKMGLYDNTRKVEVLGEDLAIPVVVVGKDVESAIEHVLPRSSWSIRTCSSTAVKTSKPTAARELCNFAKNVRL